MNHLFLRILFISALLTLTSSGLFASLLGTYSISPAGIVSYSTPTDKENISFHLALGPSVQNCFNRNNCPEMFLFEPFLSSTLNQEFLISDATYGGFGAVRDALTNGIDEGITLGMVFGTTLPVNIGGGVTISESQLIPSSGIDFAGLQVGSVGLTVTSLQFMPFDFIEPGAYGAFITYTVNVYDEEGPTAIPEPAGASLGAIGLLIIGAWRRRRKEQS